MVSYLGRLGKTTRSTPHLSNNEKPSTIWLKRHQCISIWHSFICHPKFGFCNSGLFVVATLKPKKPWLAFFFVPVPGISLCNDEALLLSEVKGSHLGLLLCGKASLLLVADLFRNRCSFPDNPETAPVEGGAHYSICSCLCDSFNWLSMGFRYLTVFMS